MAIEGAIQRVEYDINRDEETEVLLWIRDKNGERKRVRITDPPSPYFYTIDENVNERDSSLIQRAEIVDKTALYNPLKEVTKITTKSPPQVGELRKSFNFTYEADIIYPERYLIDSGLKYGVRIENEEIKPIKSNIEPVKMYLDIEVIGGDSVNNIEEAKGKIVIIGTYIPSRDKERYFVMEHPKLEDTEEITQFEQETHLVRNFIRFVENEDPDILIGKNLKGYDLTFLKNRCEKIGASFDRLSPIRRTSSRRGINISGRDVLDWENYYEFLKDTELESHRMHDILEDELDWEPVSITDFTECWENDPKRLLKRNKHDITGPAEIDEEMSIIKFFNELRKIVGCRLPNTKYMGKLCDIYYMRELKDKDIIAPSKGMFKNDSSYSGGEVIEPRRGRWEGVIVVDLHSAYPSIMRTFNVSPETFIPEKDEYAYSNYNEIKGTKFKTSKKGIIPIILEDLLERRGKKKRLMNNSSGKLKDRYYTQQYALKQLANSFYGLLGDSKSRYYKYPIASAITAGIRELIVGLKEELEKRGDLIVAGDTDSVFCKTDKDPDDLMKESNEIIDNIVREGWEKDKHYMEMGIDYIIDAILIKEKKLYAAKLDDGTIKKKGIASRRSDTAPIAKEIQTEMIEKMLDGDDKNEVSQTIRDQLNEIKNGQISIKKIGVPTKFSKDPEEYDKTRMRNKLNRKSKKYLDKEYSAGDKPKRVICNVVGMMPAWEDEDLKDFKIDYEQMIEKYVRPKVKPFLSSYGLDWKKDISGQREIGDWGV